MEENGSEVTVQKVYHALEIIRSTWHILLFIICMTIGVCFWLANNSATLQNIEQNQKRQYQHECEHDRDLRDYFRSERTVLGWLEKQSPKFNDGTAPDLPGVPYATQYCPPQYQQDDEQNHVAKPDSPESINSPAYTAEEIR